MGYARPLSLRRYNDSCRTLSGLIMVSVDRGMEVFKKRLRKVPYTDVSFYCYLLSIVSKHIVNNFGERTIKISIGNCVMPLWWRFSCRCDRLLDNVHVQVTHGRCSFVPQVSYFFRYTGQIKSINGKPKEK